MSVKGRADEGVRETRLGAELDPLNARLNHLHGIALRYARRYDEAVEYHRRAAQLDHEFVATHYHAAWAYLLKGMYHEALAEMDTAARLDSSRFGAHAVVGPVYGRAFVGVIHGREGKRAEALATLRHLEKGSRTSPWPARAYIYAAVGDRERTLEALDQMIEQREFPQGPTLGNAIWDPVRSDPRFAQLLKKAGL